MPSADRADKRSHWNFLSWNIDVAAKARPISVNDQLLNLHIKRSEVNPMRRIALLALAAIGLALALPPAVAEAKGCIKGAVAGGIAGHYAGHHGFLGAVSGCIAGRRTAKRHPPAHSTTGNVQSIPQSSRETPQSR